MGDISELPEDIIHEILGYLKATKQPQVCIFCKTWYRAWIAYPILIFKKKSKNRKKYLNFIGRTLQRYQEKKIPIEELILTLDIDSSSGSVPPVRNWVRIAVQNGVKRLNLRFRLGWKDYTLYHTVFEGNSLRELTLEDDKIGRREEVESNDESDDESGLQVDESGLQVDESGLGGDESGLGDDDDESGLESDDDESRGRVTMMNQDDDKVMFNHLHTLCLSNINIDDDMFEGLIASCPLIETLSLQKCKTLKRIKLTKQLYRLTTIDVLLEGLRNLDVEIEAPNLQDLYLDIVFGSVKLCKTDKLKSLMLCGSNIDLSSTSLDNWEHNFPQVEDVYLSGVKGHRRINLSSLSLKRINCSTSKDLTKVNIDAPNLVLLVLYGILDVSLTNAPSQCELIFHSAYGRPFDTDQFCKLKLLLAMATYSKISLSLGSPHLVDVGRIPTSPVVEVEDLKLNFDFSRELVESNFLEALFLTCHPKTILVRSKPDLVGYLSKKLIEGRKREIESWSRELKEVQLQIQIYDDNDIEQWQPCEWGSLSEDKQLPHYFEVCFRLEWKI